MVVALANSKGGVGKSTLSVHLAVWFHEQGKKVVLVDSDVQESSSKWLVEVAPEIPVFRLHTPDDVLEQVPKIASEVDVVVVDGPAGLSEVTRAVLLVTDKAFLPCGPSVLDLRAVAEAIRVVRQAQKIRHGAPEARLIPNKLQANYRLSRELVETAQGLEIPAAAGLRLRQAYADAAGQGTVVWRMGRPGAEAGEEIKRLFKEIFEDATSIDEPSVANG